MARKAKITSRPEPAVSPTVGRRAAGEKAPETSHLSSKLLILSAILLLTIVVYARSLNNGFVAWDDPTNVYENPFIRELSRENLKAYFTKPLLAMYTPLVYLSFAVDYQIGGLDPRVYHTTNLILHLVNVSLVFMALWLLTRRTEIAAVAALLFAVHPLNTAAVAPVSTRSTLLYALFFLAAFLGYIRYLQTALKLRYIAVALGSFLVALLSKSAAVVLPLVLVLTDYYVGRPFDRRAVVEKIPFFALSLLFGILTFALREDFGQIGNPLAFSIVDRIFIVAYSIAFYLVKVFIPTNLSAYYPYPAKVGGLLPVWFYLAPLVVAAVGFVLYQAVKHRARELLFGVLFFFINILLILRFVPIGGEMVCDRYAYLPYIGIFIIIGWACWRIGDRARSQAVRWKYLALTAVSLYAMAFSIISFDRVKIWENGLVLFNDVLDRYPVALMYYNRGNYRYERQNFTEAMADYTRAIELDPDAFLAHYGRGNVRMVWKDYAGAAEDYSRVIALNRDHMNAYLNRGAARMIQNRYPEAIADFTEALRLAPGNPALYLNRGWSRWDMSDRGAACTDWRKALDLGAQEAAAILQKNCTK